LQLAGCELRINDRRYTIEGAGDALVVDMLSNSETGAVANDLKRLVLLVHTDLVVLHTGVGYARTITYRRTSGKIRA
jgi:hypothetical protein